MKLEMQGDAQFTQLAYFQQRRQDVLAYPVVDQHLPYGLLGTLFVGGLLEI